MVLVYGIEGASLRLRCAVAMQTARESAECRQSSAWQHLNWSNEVHLKLLCDINYECDDKLIRQQITDPFRMLVRWNSSLSSRKGIDSNPRCSYLRSCTAAIRTEAAERGRLAGLRLNIIQHTHVRTQWFNTELGTRSVTASRADWI